MTDVEPGQTQDQKPVEPAAEPAVETVPRAEFDKVLKQMTAAQAQARATAEQLEKIRIDGLKSKEEYKSLYDEEIKKRESAENERETIKKTMITDRKLTAIREAAVKAGMLDSALPDLEVFDFPEVNIETTTTRDGRIKIEVTGAHLAVQKLKSQRPHWFSKGEPNVNTASPGVGSGGGAGDLATISKEINAAETQARSTGMKSDWDKVRALHLKYKQVSEQRA